MRPEEQHKQGHTDEEQPEAMQHKCEEEYCNEDLVQGTLSSSSPFFDAHFTFCVSIHGNRLW